MRLVSCADGLALRRETTRFLTEALVTHRGHFVALAVGESTLPLYAQLEDLGPAWAGRAVMPVDELVPPPSDPARRFSARLAGALGESLHPRLAPIDVDGDPDVRALEVEARLRIEGLAAVVLGLGPDGHFAFNQPPTAADAVTRVVSLSPGNLSRLGPVHPSRAAVTLGVPTVLAAGSILVVASGDGKAEALEHLLEGPEDPDWPVTWLRRHPRLSVAIDQSCSDGR